ncbi:MAG: carboxypeptidase-like regulatory domain-containing protein [Bryobacteraceae bacterium]
MFKSRLALPLLGALLGSFFLAAPAAFAQSASSAINGTAQDNTGAVVPGAKVTVTNQATNVRLETTTSAEGTFSMPGLQSGTYEVSVSKEGFNKFIEKDIFVGPSVVRSVPATLSVGGVETSVTVEASGAQVQLTTSQVSNFVAEKQVEELPLNGRNYQSLSALMPGVVNTAVGQSQGQGGFNTGNTMSINGMGTGATLYLLDGIWNMNTGNMTQTTITPNPDTIQEVRTLQNNVAQKYALLGASVVLLQTRSGSSQFHGALFEYVRNDAFDARNFFAPDVLPLKQNIFGGTIGGPVFIPKLYPRDKSKTFFFFSEQAVRKHIASTLLGSTATADMRNGLFPNKIIDPNTGNPFPQNSAGQYVIPQDRINPSALTLMNALTNLPNNPGGGFQNYINTNPEILSQNDIQIKVDHSIGSKLRLMGEYFDLRQTDDQPSHGWVGSPFTGNTQSFLTRSKLAEIQATYIISPNMVNQISLGMNNYVVDLTPNKLVYKDQLPDFQSTLPFNGFLSNRLPSIGFSGGWSGFGVAQTMPLIHASDLEDTLTDDWSYVKGKHTIEAGFNLVFSTKRQNIFSASNGNWVFSGKFSGDPIADYLLGRAASFNQTNGERRPYIHGIIASPYVQDTWKVAPRLTLNYGLRMMYMPLANIQPGYGSLFVPSKYSLSKAPTVNANGTITTGPNYDPLNGLVFNGENGVPQNFSNDHRWYFNPTVGFAWDVTGKGTTSLRGGFGVTRARVFTGTDCTYSCPGNPPFIQNISLTNPLFPNPVGSGTADAAGAQSLAGAGLDNQATAVYTYSLSVEQQWKGWLFSIGGAGNQVRHQGIGMDLNQPFKTSTSDFPTDINTGTFPYVYGPYYGWGAISHTNTVGNATWNGLMMSARHTMGHGLFLSGAYTWAHGLQDGQGSSFGGNGVQDSYDVKGNRGNSSVNVAHVASFSWIYDIPFMQKSKGLQRALLGGWKYNGIATVQSGVSMSVGLSVANQGLASRPNATGQALSYPKSVDQWFSPGAFTAPAPGMFGNAGTGTLTGPGIVNFDMGLYKDFRINERAKVQFRTEFFNVFNHTNFSGVSTTYGSGNFGAVTSALDPRIMEFSLRFQY